ncbi:MAG: glycine cleavage system aminomethyltransferase GcvT [Spirochaetaceae bacterium]|nr:MAG: glycine cleavage system aminomethyltransferase GcvT [Spirochaetaceae bacterium]
MMRTPLYEKHRDLEARLVEFAGWEMPVQYPTGIVEEHLSVRRGAGLFDVSHMGRFLISGGGCLPFLQHILTNNAAALEPGRAQYTMIPNTEGGAIDDAYLYRPDRPNAAEKPEYLLVVNAANRGRDWDHLQSMAGEYSGIELQDRSDDLSMLSLQGPESRQMLIDLFAEEALPEPGRNNLVTISWSGTDVTVARTGYTGEPLGFELFVSKGFAERLWDRLLEAGAAPIGLGARDTLRLEAGLPLFGHELGSAPENGEIPIFACPLARLAVSFSPLKDRFIGRGALEQQFAAYRRIVKRDYSELKGLPRMIRPFELLDKGIARQGAEVFTEDRRVGWVTSGTMAPYWIFEGEGLCSVVSERSGRRAIGMALIDSDIEERAEIEIDVRGRRLKALVVPYLLRAEAPPFARPVVWGAVEEMPETAPAGERPESPRPYAQKARELLRQSIENTRWRQQRCINLIPSEMTHSSLTRLLSIMDPSFRYGEHRKVKAFNDAEIFYYQGTDFIDAVEHALGAELRRFLGCQEVETRVVSGQMANMALFSALVDYLNRDDRKSEPRRIRSIMNNHIIKGGHLSAQPMGALRDFVARDPVREAPAVVNFPVCGDDPYRIDTARLPELLERSRPELIVLGKSMILYREPVREIRRIAEELSLDTLIMYDMAHVLGLAGPHFQEPFLEGADVVTGSTHKTFFGTQRGLLAANWTEEDPGYELWEAVQRRTFPGSVSNHHLGTLLGLLLATYEMNAFKEEYQKAVIANAKSFARALNDAGLSVAGDPAVGYTETHQVVVELGYCQGIEAARRLEENNIILNFQASPREEGFTASGALRMGVSEMTRFGMGPEDFRSLAGLIRAAVLDGKSVLDEVIRLRSGFQDLRYCFADEELEQQVQELHGLI